MKIPTDINATSIDEAQAMTLTAKQIRLKLQIDDKIKTLSIKRPA